MNEVIFKGWDINITSNRGNTRIFTRICLTYPSRMPAPVEFSMKPAVCLPDISSCAGAVRAFPPGRGPGPPPASGPARLRPGAPAKKRLRSKRLGAARQQTRSFEAIRVAHPWAGVRCDPSLGRATGRSGVLKPGRSGC